jgi:hypothetical protein
MLVRFRKGEKWVTFNYTKGINGTKFKVMDLVDTLRNTRKEIIVSRAHMGLLLKGPLCTGECHDRG